MIGDTPTERFEIIPYAGKGDGSDSGSWHEPESDGHDSWSEPGLTHEFFEVPPSQIEMAETMDIPLILRSEKFRSLLVSINTSGYVQNPVHVQPEQDGIYRLITGRQRYLAAKHLRHEYIRVHVTDEKPALVVFKDNVLRGTVTVIQEAEIYDELRQSKETAFGTGYTQAELAELTSRSQSTIAEILSVMKLPKEIRDKFRFEAGLSRRAILDTIRNASGMDSQGMYDALQAQMDDQNAAGTRTKSDPVKMFLQKITALADTADKLNIQHLSSDDGREICAQVRRLLERFAPIIEELLQEEELFQEATKADGDAGEVVEGEIIE